MPWKNTTSVIINKRKFAFYFSVGIVAIIFILASFLAMMGDHTTFADVPGLMLAIVAIIPAACKSLPDTPIRVGTTPIRQPPYHHGFFSKTPGADAKATARSTSGRPAPSSAWTRTGTWSSRGINEARDPRAGGAYTSIALMPTYSEQDVCIRRTA